MHAPTLGTCNATGTGGGDIGGGYAAAVKRGQARCGSEAELSEVMGSPPHVHRLVEEAAEPSVKAEEPGREEGGGGREEGGGRRSETVEAGGGGRES